MKMICCICHKKIDKLDTYFKVELYSEGDLMGTDLAHKTCKDNQGQLGNQLNFLVQGVTDFATKNGIVKEKVIVI